MMSGYYNVVIRADARFEGKAAPPLRAPARPPVRRAVREDAGVIEAMMRAMAQESPVYRSMKIDDGRLARFIARTIGSKDHAVLLHESADGADGLFIGMLVQQFFTLDSARKSLASARKGASVP
jgi:hypothetical protein